MARKSKQHSAGIWGRATGRTPHDEEAEVDVRFAKEIGYSARGARERERPGFTARSLMSNKPFSWEGAYP